MVTFTNNLVQHHHSHNFYKHC